MGNAAIISIPGSGKTTLLMSKIANLFDSDPNATVCAVTFTAKAADEMRIRIKELIGEVGESRLLIKTFNALGLWQLRQAKIKTPTLIKDWEARKLIKDFMVSQHAPDAPPSQKEIDDCFQAVGLIKTSRALRNGWKDALKEKFEPIHVQAYFFYEENLRASRRMDFTDQILMAYQGMVDGYIPPLPYKYLLVDEFQDSDELQVDWTVFHALKGIKTTIVGDDDQAIYEFRGASGFEGFSYFLDKVSDAKEIVLNKNYRSHQEILTHSQKLIEKNQDRIYKELVAHKGDGGNIHIINGMDQFDIIINLIELLISDRYEGNWCILTRNNTEITFIAQILQEHGVDYVELSKFNPLEIKEVAMFLSMAKNIDDDKALLAEQIFAYFGVPSEVIKKFRDDFAGGDMATLFNHPETLENLSSKSFGNKNMEKAINHLKSIISLNKYIRIEHYPPALEAIMDTIADSPMYSAKAASNILSVIKKRLISSEGSLRMRVANLIRSYEERMKNSEVDMSEARVILMTSHNSKGLEFDNVAIPFLNEGDFPFGEEIESERRLCFVAMTRAKKRLVLGHQIYRLVPGTLNIIDYMNMKRSKTLNPVIIGDTRAATSGVIEVDDEETGKVKRYSYQPVDPSRFIKEAGLEPKLTVDTPQ